MNLDEEEIAPCWVCGKVWRRGDADSWYYFNGLMVCRSHKGAHAWYAGALALAQERYINRTMADIKKAQ